MLSYLMFFKGLVSGIVRVYVSLSRGKIRGRIKLVRTNPSLFLEAIPLHAVSSIQGISETLSLGWIQLSPEMYQCAVFKVSCSCQSHWPACIPTVITQSLSGGYPYAESSWGQKQHLSNGESVGSLLVLGNSLVFFFS